MKQYSKIYFSSPNIDNILSLSNFSKVSKVYCLDILGVENFDEIALPLTVKEIEAILCFSTKTVKEIEAILCFATFGQNSKI